MADSYTSLLNLTKIEVNGSASTWGAKLNANADAIDAHAVALAATVATLQTALAAAQQASVPVNGIVMFSGSVAPTGWALCNGLNGTPDLRDRFVVGTGASYALGGTGGSALVTLVEAQMPTHAHGVVDPGHAHGVTDPQHYHAGVTANAGSHTHGLDQQVLGGSPTGGPGSSSSVWGLVSPSTTAAGDHAHAFNTYYSPTGIAINAAGTGISLGAAGSGAAHENRPPFYALAYIMRII